MFKAVNESQIVALKDNSIEHLASQATEKRTYYDYLKHLELEVQDNAVSSLYDCVALQLFNSKECSAMIKELVEKEVNNNKLVLVRLAT